MTIQKLKSGVGLVEVLVAVFIFSLLLSALIVVTNMYLSGAEDNLKSAQAAYIAEEGIEAVKILADVKWSNISSLSTSTNYSLLFSTTTSMWATTTVATPINSFQRTFQLADLFRNANGKLVTSAGTIDTKSKKVTVSVSWLTKTGTTTKSLSTYITNIIGN